jgi:hypothetical protein
LETLLGTEKENLRLHYPDNPEGAERRGEYPAQNPDSGGRQKDGRQICNARKEFYKNWQTMLDTNREKLPGMLADLMRSDQTVFNLERDEDENGNPRYGSLFTDFIENPDISLKDKLDLIGKFPITGEQAQIMANYVLQKYTVDVMESALKESTKGELWKLANKETGNIETALFDGKPVTVLHEKGGMAIARDENVGVFTVPAYRIDRVESRPVEQLADKTAKLINDATDASNDLVDEEERNEIRHGEEMVIDGKKWKVYRVEETSVDMIDGNGGTKSMKPADFLALRNSQREREDNPVAGGTHGKWYQTVRGYETDMRWATKEEAEAAAQSTIEKNRIPLHQKYIVMARIKGMPKTGGRKKGTPNKTTVDLRTWISTLIESSMDQVESDIKTLEPRERCLFIEKLLQYVIPKKREQDQEKDGKEVLPPSKVVVEFVDFSEIQKINCRLYL